MRYFRQITYILLILTLTIGQALSSSRINLDEVGEEERNQIIKTKMMTDPALIKPLYQMAKDVTELLDKHNIKYWASFGTLLGAVRQVDEGGKFKGGLPCWDDDFDFGIMEEDAPKVRKDPFLKELHSLGYAIADDELVGIHLYQLKHVILSDGQNEVQPFLDLFFTRKEAEKYVLALPKARDFFKNAWYGIEQLQTLVRYPFGGFEIWGPSNSHAYLSRKYGEEWATKGLYHYAHHKGEADAVYIWTLSPQDLQPASYEGVLQNRVTQAPQDFVQQNEGYWNTYYAGQSLERRPSTFACYVYGAGYIQPNQTLLELGCGNGRDTFFFLNSGIKAIGLDLSTEAIRLNNEHALSLGFTINPFFAEDVTAEGALKKYIESDAVYARFFMHSITEERQQTLLRSVAQVKPGTKLLLEFRTDKDPLFDLSTKVGETIGRTDHYRRFINLETFIGLLKGLKFKIIEQLEKKGLSVYFKQDQVHGLIKDDPVLARIYAVKE